MQKGNIYQCTGGFLVHWSVSYTLYLQKHLAFITVLLVCNHVTMWPCCPCQYNIIFSRRIFYMKYSFPPEEKNAFVPDQHMDAVTSHATSNWFTITA